MKQIFLLAITIVAYTASMANGLQVSNVTYSGAPGSTSYNIEFDIAWENSWRTSTYESNHDAAWIFAKWRLKGEQVWSHVILDGLAAAAPSGSEFIFPSDNVGAFVQRSADGIGDVSYEGVQLAWELEVPFSMGDKVEVYVYAIEMVYIPEGAFELGDGIGPYDMISFESVGSDDPFPVQSEAAITLGGNVPGSLGLSAGFSSVPDDFDDVTEQELGADFPKGFASFYMMKYEISQGQYASFLNTISIDDIILRWPGVVFSGQSIVIAGEPTFFEAGSPERAANFLDWSDLASYADWAGLRPMSEFEFEKACRGTEASFPHEFAWGDATIYSLEYQVSFRGGSEELILNPSHSRGNAIHLNAALSDDSEGPTRCGLFAASTEAPSRQEAGASYYGVLDLSGNVQEQVVAVGTPEGRSFNGAVHGDGLLDGDAPDSWLAISDSEGEIIGLGSGNRGGSFNDTTGKFIVSNRVYANRTVDLKRSDTGGRLVRSDF